MPPGSAASGTLGVVPLLVVRHADAFARSHWDGDDRERPLSPEGRRQALALSRRLAVFAPATVVSSPYARCVETVAPLAAAVGADVETDWRLAEGAGGEAAYALVASLGDGAVLCSHGDVIPALIGELSARWALDVGAKPKFEKGSVWVLHRADGLPACAEYLPPASRR